MPVGKHINTNNGNCYFLTLNTVDWVDVFIRPVYKNAIVDTLNYFTEKKGMIIHAWCLMSNHLHLVAKAEEGADWAWLLREIKRFSTKEVLAAMDNEREPECRRKWMMKHFESPVSVTRQHTAKYHLWQDGNHPVLLKGDNPAAILQQIHKIHDNPVRCMIVDKAASYVYSSARDYAGNKGLVKVSPFKILSAS